MTPEQEDILLHATANGAGWRRYYVLFPDSDGVEEADGLCALGLMVREDLEYQLLFTATDAGIEKAAELYEVRLRAYGMRPYTAQVDNEPPIERWAESAGKVRYQIAQQIADVIDIPMLELFRRIKVRRAR